MGILETVGKETVLISSNTSIPLIRLT